MTDARARQLLASLKATEYVETQRRVGRAGLEASFVREVAAQHRAASSLLAEAGLSAELKKAVTLLREITYPLAMQERSDFPGYYPYTCVNILDWFMKNGRGGLEDLKRRSILGIVALLADVGRFELHSFVGCEPLQPLHFEPQLALARIQLLREVFAAVRHASALIPGCSCLWPPEVPCSDRLENYTSGPERLQALVYFSCLPRTQFHDEVLFLRAIHVSELCFYGVRIATAQAVRALRRGAAATACAALEQAAAFADVLRHTFLLLRTMPPEHFHDFRAATANASAVQSINYQLMDIQLFGLSEHKVAAFKRSPYLRCLLRHGSGGPSSLRSLIAALPSDGDDAAMAALLEAARSLDRKLLAWRGLHVAFAVEYLAGVPVGTGGTSGAPYLKLFLRDTLFEETRKEVRLDEAPSDGCGEVGRGEGGIPGVHLAPPRDLMGPDQIRVKKRRA
jgi:tryptophan 2,3-dioxygenase